jgi:hypothetical protein
MRFLRLLVPLLAFSFAATACKSDLGQRCQLDGDCDEGRCSTDGVCRIDVGTVDQDAAPADGPIDAALDELVYDARPGADARPPSDALIPVDATPAVDAEPFDAP